MTKEQMDTDGFTGHGKLHRVAKRRFRRAAEDFMRTLEKTGAYDVKSLPVWNRLVVAWEALERSR